MNRMLKLKGLLIFGTSVAEKDEKYATDEVVSALFEELECNTIREAQTLLKAVYEQDASLDACCSGIGELVLKRLHRGMDGNENRYNLNGIYVFDADKYYNSARDTWDVLSILHTIEFLGDGTIVEPTTETYGVCKGRHVQPMYCRRIV